MSVRINGIAHIQLTVIDAERCLPFWERFCNFMGMETLIKGDDVIYSIGGRTGILIREAPKDRKSRGSEERFGGRFDQDRAGLHHFCFRARSREDVEAIHAFIEAYILYHGRGLPITAKLFFFIRPIQHIHITALKRIL